MKNLNNSLQVTLQPATSFTFKYLPENNSFTRDSVLIKNSLSITEKKWKPWLVFTSKYCKKEIPIELVHSSASATSRPGYGIKKQEEDSKHCSIFLHVSWISGDDCCRIIKLLKVKKL